MCVDPLFFLPPLAFLLIDRSLLAPAALLAALLHECGHIVMLKLLGGRVRRIVLHPFGGEIDAGGRMLSYGQETLLSFAGVAVNLASAPLCRLSVPFLHELGVCSAGLAFFNLLPARGLDGGDILENLLLLFLPDRAAHIILTVFTSVSSAFLAALFLFGMRCARFNPVLPLLSAYLLFKAFSAN